MRPWHLLSALILLVCASTHRVAAQTPAPASVEVIRLVGGSSLVGRVTAARDGKIHISVNGRGAVVIDSAAVASRSPDAPPTPPAPWSGTVAASMTHLAPIAPGTAGLTLGAQ